MFGYWKRIALFRSRGTFQVAVLFIYAQYIRIMTWHSQYADCSAAVKSSVTDWMGANNSRRRQTSQQVNINPSSSSAGRTNSVVVWILFAFPTQLKKLQSLASASVGIELESVTSTTWSRTDGATTCLVWIYLDT